jgi:predicted hotdog family 3-hydroxylacyl-ACP dehydratase
VLLDRGWIEEHIPHKHGMCLLDEVLNWDFTQTQCRTSTHRSPDNPLRSNGRLGSACGIEYAAQTMAVHGALVASASGGTAPPGFLASVRAVRLNVDRLDVFETDLVTSVNRVAGDENTALYEFSVLADNVVLVMGRAAIAFNLFAGVAPAVTSSSGAAAVTVEHTTLVGVPGAAGLAGVPGAAGFAGATGATAGGLTDTAGASLSQKPERP